MGFPPLCGEKRDELMTYYDAGQYDIAVIGAGHMGPHRRWGALCAYKRFGLQAKTLAQVEFISPEHFNFSRVPAGPAIRKRKSCL